MMLFKKRVYLPTGNPQPPLRWRAAWMASAYVGCCQSSWAETTLANWKSFLEFMKEVSNVRKLKFLKQILHRFFGLSIMTVHTCSGSLAWSNKASTKVDAYVNVSILFSIIDRSEYVRCIILSCSIVEITRQINLICQTRWSFVIAANQKNLL